MIEDPDLISKKRLPVQTLDPTITNDDFLEFQKEKEEARNAQIIDYIDSQINQDKIQQANIVKKAEKLKEFIPQFNGQPFIGNDYAAEIGGYFSISKGKGTFGELKPARYNKDQQNKIKTAIHYFRLIPVDNPIKQLINSYQSDPDADDIIQANQDERFKSQMYANYRISRYFNLDPSKPFFSRDLEHTGLGNVIIRLMNEEEEDDKFVIGYNRLFNILFETFVHLVLMALVFPSWPSFTPPFLLKKEPRISVYVGTYDAESGDANCLNFKLFEIKTGSIAPGSIIRVYAPVTSASNDAKVAIDKFAKTNGSIIKINLANGKSFMCVSTSPNEAETFVLAGEYQYIRKYHFIDLVKGTLTVYEFNQLNTDFTGLTSDELTQEFWNFLKEKIPIAIRSAFQQSEMSPLRDKQQSLIRTITGTAIALKTPRYAADLFYVSGAESGDEDEEAGGSKPTQKSKSNRKSNRKTNKRRNQNKRKTNKRRKQKRRTNKRRRI